MRIALVVWGLRGSGPGRMTLRLAQMWTARGERPAIVTVGPGSGDFYDVPSGIERRALRPLQGPERLLPTRVSATRELALVAGLRRVLAEVGPEVIVSHWCPVNVRVLLAARRLGVPVVVRDDRAPHESLGRTWSLLRRRLYPRAHAGVALNPGEGRWLGGLLRPGALEVIPQLVDLPETLPERCEEPVVLAAGRLIAVKRFELLVEAFAATRVRRRGWRLRIVGEGPERARIEARAHELGVSDAVELPGTIADIWPEYARAGVFALTSSYESFPMTLIEAMSAGVPVVAFDAQTGPQAIVTHEVDGLLAPTGDVGGLAAAIDRLADDADLRASLTARSRLVADELAPERVLARWDDLLAKVVR